MAGKTKTKKKTQRSAGQIQHWLSQKKRKKDRLNDELSGFQASGNKDAAERRRNAMKEVNTEIKDLRDRLKKAKAAK